MMHRFFAILLALMIVATGAQAIDYESPTDIMMSPPTDIDDNTPIYIPSNPSPNAANPE